MSKVLLVDKDATRAQAIRAVLERSGYEIVVAGDGNEGLRCFLDELPELVMVGAMAANPAETFCERLRETRPGSNTPLVFYAESLRGEELRKALERTGCNVYLEMPASDQRLVEVCRHTLMESGHSLAEDGGGPAYESPDAAVNDLATSGPDIDEHLQSMFETGAPPAAPRHRYEREARPESEPARRDEPTLAIDFPGESPGEIQSASLPIDPPSDSEIDAAAGTLPEPPLPDESDSPSFDPEDTLPTVPSADVRPAEFGFEVTDPADEDVPADHRPGGFDLVEPPADEGEGPAAADPASPLDDVGFSIDEETGPEPQPMPVGSEPMIPMAPETSTAPVEMGISRTPVHEAAVVEPVPAPATPAPAPSARGWLWTAAVVVLLAGAGALLFTFGPVLIGDKPAPRHVARTPDAQPVHPSDAPREPTAVTAPAATGPESTGTAAADLTPEAAATEPSAAEIEEATEAMLAADAMNPEPEVARVDPTPADRAESRNANPAASATPSTDEVAATTTEPANREAPPEPEVSTPTPAPVPAETVASPTPAAAAPPPKPAPARPDPVEPAYVPSTETVELSDTPIAGYTPPKPVRQPKPDYDPADVPEGGETVVLRVLVNDWGKVVRVVVDEGRPGSPRVDAAVDAVLNTRYEPAVKNGREVRAWTLENFHFAPR